ncbi:hypothetical protein ACFW95_09665 [Streptomyces sp. NPDC059474]|uniref:hypothetical protein n=1 Tax=Streptomyces sp. NPDC059474 TaxID=3346846 RepID=UPI0036ABD5F7
MQKAIETPVKMSVEPLAQEYVEILRLADTPHLSNSFDKTIAPYSVWITYRREAGVTEHTWHADVSGYRVLANGVVDMDATSVDPGRRGRDPHWLTGLIEKHTPSW